MPATRSMTKSKCFFILNHILTYCVDGGLERWGALGALLLGTCDVVQMIKVLKDNKDDQDDHGEQDDQDDKGQ